MRRMLVAVLVSFSVAGLAGAPAVRGSAPPALPSATPAATCAAPAFASPRYHPLGAFAAGLAAADFNGDGRTDLAVTNWGSDLVGSGVSVLLGDGAGGFGPATTTPIGALDPSGPAVGDLDGDARADVVVATFDDESIAAGLSVLLGDGAGSLGPPSSFPVGPGIAPTSVLVVDVDGDDDLDAIVSSVRDDATFGGTVHVLKGDGMGGFGPPADLPVAIYPTDLAVDDFDHDGRLDLAVVNFGEEPPPGGIEIRLGDGAGGFGPPVSSHAVRFPYGVAGGDFDEDGEVDLAVVTADPTAGGSAQLLLGDGTGRFGPPTAFPTFFGAFALEPVDVTGDGHLDLVVSGYYPQGSFYLIGVLLGDGRGGLGAPAPFAVDGLGPAVADFDADGRRDVAVGGGELFTRGHAALLLSMCGNVADLAVSLDDSPDPVAMGQQVTYTLQVVNEGPDAASATAGVTLPPGVAFVSASASVGNCLSELPPDRTARCALGDLDPVPPGNARTVTVVARAEEGGLKEVTGTAVTSVLDPDPANDAETETTRVTVLGGAGLTIVGAPGGALLTWRAGDLQAGYVVGRIAGGVRTRFPPEGMLPPETTSFVDSTAVAGQINCYQVAPMTGEGTGLGLSDVLCIAPDTAAPPGTLGDLRLRLVPPGLAELTWSPFGGQTLYVLREYRAGGPGQSLLEGSATSASVAIPEPSCYVLIPVNETTPLGNSAALCGVPGAGTLGGSSSSPRELFSSLGRAVAALPRGR
jgi:uncharacterized repeat protein (TIGR01451 family)